MQIENLSWFPGHMTKTKRMISAEIKNMDAVCEIVDARIPLSSRNPDVDELTAEIQKVIKASNQGVDAVDQMTTVESEIPVNISVPANTKLTMTAQQVVTTVAYTFNIMSTSGSSYSVVVNTLVPANSVSVTTDFTPGDTHTVPGGDGTGGGGSN